MINIKTDSRKVKKGDIFAAIKCEVNDGHKYIDAAIKNGASKIICEHGKYNIPYTIVDNSRLYLENYLKENYNKYLEEMTIIGITGTTGKTTTAYLIYDMLNKLGIKCGYIGTVGYYLNGKVSDLPNTNPDICEMYDMLINAYDNDYKVVVIEASSQGLDFGRLNNIPFSYACFTNLTQDHLDYHKTMGNYALAKQIAFKNIKENGVAIINNDDKYKEYFLLDQNKNITYGFSDSDFKITNYSTSIHGTSFTFEHNKEKCRIDSKLIGKYNIYNLISIVALLSTI